MARAAVLGRLTWARARLARRRRETPSAASLAFDVPDWPGHLAGQHVDVRLTADDGYTAQRSYSIASAPEAGGLELTVERLADGEVSPYLVDALAEGDEVEVRGPIGGHFVWSADRAEPLALIAGGSGIVPLMCMLRHRAAAGGRGPASLLLSARTAADVIYRDELRRLADGDATRVAITLTRERPADWTGLTGRVERAMIEQITPPPAQEPAIFVCGPTGFVEAAADALVEVGHPPARVKTERFGPTGG